MELKVTKAMRTDSEYIYGGNELGEGEKKVIRERASIYMIDR